MEPEANRNDFEQCVAVVCQGYLALHRRQFEAAQQAFALALILARSLSADDAADMVPLVLFNMSLLQLRQGRSEDSRKIP